MSVILILIAVVAVITIVVRPFRVAPEDDADEAGELEAEKLAKYRELRELELDYRTGKLTEADYQQTRAQLRRQAAELLDRSSPAPEHATHPNGSHATAPGAGEHLP